LLRRRIDRFDSSHRINLLFFLAAGPIVASRRDDALGHGLWNSDRDTT
jgi:hypothetical protein